MLESPLTYLALMIGTIYVTYKWFTSEKHKSSSNDWYTYGRYLQPAEFFFAFIMFTIVFFLATTYGANADYPIAYTFLTVSLFFVVLSCVVFFSKRFDAWVWRHVWQKEPKTDRNWLAGILLFLAAAFGFGFFLFYPLFISIG